MNRLRLLQLFLGALALCGVRAVGSAHEPDQAQIADDRQILVMLKLAPPHFRPGGSYGGSYGDAQSNAARRRIAHQIARKYGLELVDNWPMPLLSVDCYVMQVPSNLSVEDAIEKISRHSMVSWTQPMQTYRANTAGSSDDPLFGAAPAATSWRLADLHRVATGRGVSIAVIDSKIDVSHPDLGGQFAAVVDFVSRRKTPPEQHGTGVAGVIGAKANNGIGIAGIAPRSRLMALRACWQTGPGATGQTLCNSLSLARALQFAVEHDAQVINLSLSGPNDRLLRKLIAIAIARKATVVAAFDPNLPKGGFPASQPGVIAVIDESLQTVPSRLYGAPGQNVPTTQPGGRWNLVSGSSYAAAHVSGLVALVREQRPTPSPIALARSADGSVDACATLFQASLSCACPCPPEAQARPRPAVR